MGVWGWVLLIGLILGSISLGVGIRNMDKNGRIQDKKKLKIVQGTGIPGFLFVVASILYFMFYSSGGVDVLQFISVV